MDKQGKEHSGVTFLPFKHDLKEGRRWFKNEKNLRIKYFDRG